MSGKGLKKPVIIGNVYRPPRNTNNGYQSFINEFTPILSHLDKRNSEIILAGDYNIDLLQINLKRIVGEFWICSHLIVSIHKWHFPLDSLQWEELSLITFFVNFPPQPVRALHPYLPVGCRTISLVLFRFLMLSLAERETLFTQQAILPQL